MQAAGAQIVKHYRELAFMGFLEVIANLPTILKNIKRCKADVLAFAPDVLVLIDYPGFNLRIAKWARARGLKVVYYISPQVWAWKAGRVKEMKKTIDELLVILPFEKQWYSKHWQWNVTYVGHPLIEEIEQQLAQPVEELLYPLPMVALLPGSRKQEIKKKLPIMLKLAASLPSHQFVIAQAPGLEAEFYDEFLQGMSNVAVVKQATYNLLRQSDAALVTSGTATLETALLQVPQVVCYKGNPVSYAIARRLIDIKYISLVNLIADAPVVKELIQDELTVENLRNALLPLLSKTNAERKAMMDAYKNLYASLAAHGHASAKAAAIIVKHSRQ